MSCIVIPKESLGHEQSTAPTPRVEASQVTQVSPSAEGTDPVAHGKHCKPTQLPDLS